MVGSGVVLSRTPAAIHMPPPTLGEHTSEILEQLGYDEKAIGKLREQGVV
jgi:crotonobetainyl-CoA:carnitine CoA-transferase CaiB-like acyl-CoA transferase